MRSPLLPSMPAKCRWLLIFSFCWIIISCRHTGERSSAPVPDPETPKALQDGSSLADVGSFGRSSREGDLVQSLYQELVKKDPTLTELE